MLTAKSAAHPGVLLVSQILVLVEGTTPKIEIPLQLLRAINAPLLKEDIFSHNGLQQAVRSDEHRKHRRYAALPYSKGTTTDELKPQNVVYGDSVNKKTNNWEIRSNGFAAKWNDDYAYLDELVDDGKLLVPTDNGRPTKKVFIFPGGKTQQHQLPERTEDRQQTPHHVSQMQERSHNQHILATHPASLAAKGGHRSPQYKLTKPMQASVRHCTIEISTQLEGQCQSMAMVSGFACVSGDYIDVFNADCM